MGIYSSAYRRAAGVVQRGNSLSVSCGAVKGEVNPVDFIAVELIRDFVLDAYVATRSNPEKFTTSPGQRSSAE